MASGSRARPPAFPSGMNLSDYYKVDALIRLAEGRMFYLVNDNRPDRKTRRCWECGNEDNAVTATSCGDCGAQLAQRSFLLSTRWERAGFEPYLAFFDKQISHPALLSPCDVFPYPEDAPTQLCSVVPFNGEMLMLDEAAPLPIDRVIRFAQRAIGMLGMLTYNGVRLNWLHRSNFVIRPNGEFLLFDPDVAEVRDEPLPPEACAHSLRELGEILRRYTPVEEGPWYRFFLRAENGEFNTAAEFGAALRAEVPNRKVRVSTVHAGMTDVGLQRTLNEDNWTWVRLCEGVDLFVVADGMGGHDSGEVASKVAVETIAAVAEERLSGPTRPSVDALENTLYEAFQEANNTIKSMAEARGNDMGTTLVACMVVDDKVALWANVGDSRGYIQRNGQLTQITHDHSLVAKMVEQNRITAEEARNHPYSNVLLKTVGTERNVDIDLFRVDLEDGDRIMLCSDGLWGEVEDEEIEAILSQEADNRSLSRDLIRAAYRGGGKDNVTVVVINVPGTSRATPATVTEEEQPQASEGS